MPPPREPAPLGAPLFLLNLKTYPQATGAASLEIAAALARAGEELGVRVAVAPSGPDVGRVAAGVRVPTLAQHVDPLRDGPATGFVPTPTLAAAGARGSLVNHAEHPVPFAVASTVVDELSAAGLAAVVCARDPPSARRLGRLRPAYLSIEPPELIGGQRAVSTARPEVVVEGVAAVRAVAPATVVLCGAGIRRRDDVRKALELGAQGVLVASAVALAPDPAKAIAELLAGF